MTSFDPATPLEPLRRKRRDPAASRGDASRRSTTQHPIQTRGRHAIPQPRPLPIVRLPEGHKPETEGRASDRVARPGRVAPAARRGRRDRRGLSGAALDDPTNGRGSRVLQPRPDGRSALIRGSRAPGRATRAGSNEAAERFVPRPWRSATVRPDPTTRSAPSRREIDGRPRGSERRRARRPRGLRGRCGHRGGPLLRSRLTTLRRPVDGRGCAVHPTSCRSMCSR